MTKNKKELFVKIGVPEMKAIDLAIATIKSVKDKQFIVMQIVLDKVINKLEEIYKEGEKTDEWKEYESKKKQEYEEWEERQNKGEKMPFVGKVFCDITEDLDTKTNKNYL